MKYTTKSTAVEAIQWDGKKVSEFPDWLKEPWNSGVVMRMGSEVHIVTGNDEVMAAKPGDYIVRHKNGSIWPYTAAWFERDFVLSESTYTPEDGSENASLAQRVKSLEDGLRIIASDLENREPTELTLRKAKQLLNQ